MCLWRIPRLLRVFTMLPILPPAATVEATRHDHVIQCLHFFHSSQRQQRQASSSSKTSLESSVKDFIITSDKDEFCTAGILGDQSKWGIACFSEVKLKIIIILDASIISWDLKILTINIFILQAVPNGRNEGQKVWQIPKLAKTATVCRRCVSRNRNQTSW